MACLRNGSSDKGRIAPTEMASCFLVYIFPQGSKKSVMVDINVF